MPVISFEPQCLYFLTFSVSSLKHTVQGFRDSALHDVTKGTDNDARSGATPPGAHVVGDKIKLLF